MRRDEIILTIKDDGAGFEPSDYLKISPKRASHSHGRGIAIANQLSFDQIEYPGRGNEVRCTVTMTAPPVPGEIQGQAATGS